MTADLEVYFCDLCNESVPASDLEAARAVRIDDRVVGACCVGKLPAAKAAPSQAPRAMASGSGRVGGVFVAVLMLAGVAAATTFLDWRIAAEARQTKGDVVASLADRAGETLQRLAALEDALGNTAARGDVALLGPRLGNLETGVDGLVRESKSQARSIEAVAGTLAEAQRAARTREAELLATLNELNAAVQATSRDLAALRAAPRAAPAGSGDTVVTAPDRPVAPMRPATETLPPELEHSVLALADEDPGTRFAAVDKLVRSRDLRVVKPLASSAKDSNAFVRRLAVDGLREFKHVDAVDALLVALADPESVVRHTAHASLCALTRQRFEFDPDANASSRANAQRRWQDWWDKNRTDFTF